MGRKPKEDRASVKNVLVAFKVSPDERALLGRLVESRGAELSKMAGQPIAVTIGSYLTWLMLRDAEARGMSTEPPRPADPIETMARRLCARLSDDAEPSPRDIEDMGRVVRTYASELGEDPEGFLGIQVGLFKKAGKVLGRTPEAFARYMLRKYPPGSAQKKRLRSRAAPAIVST